MRRKLGGRGPYLDYENSVKGASVGMLICTYSLNQLAGQFVSQLSVSVVNHAWDYYLRQKFRSAVRGSIFPYFGNRDRSPKSPPLPSDPPHPLTEHSPPRLSATRISPRPNYGDAI